MNKEIKLDKNLAIIEKDEKVIIAKGKIHKLDFLQEIEKLKKETKNKVIFIAPFNLVKKEKGYMANGDEKIIAMQVEDMIITSREKLLSILDDNEVSIGIKKSINDKDFGEKVDEIKGEIERGNINQMIYSREFFAEISTDEKTILGMFKKILNMRGQYMTYLFNTDEYIFLGASPERHLNIENENIVMNPIAGTLGKGKKDDFFMRLKKFLENKKESDELAMVIDEELKMMMKISENGNIEFPLLKETGAVIHTEGLLKGKRKNDKSIMDVFRDTLYAPTLVGGPIKSAFEMIKKYENSSRKYYGGVFGIYDDDFLDTAIVIRSAIIDKIKNSISIRAGAGIVKDSDKDDETNETTIKANGFIGAIKGDSINNYGYLDGIDDEEKIELEKILQKRKDMISKFYFETNIDNNLEVEAIKGKRFLFINSGDDFVYMSEFMIKKMGGITKVIENKDYKNDMQNNFDIIVLGPGYGNINDTSDEKMVNLLNITRDLVKNNKKVLGICLGHQAICKTIGYKIEKQKEITQGEQREETIFGKKEKIAFYNSYSPISKNDNDEELFCDDRVLSIKKQNMVSTQCHPESIMSKNGFEILKKMILDLI